MINKFIKKYISVFAACLCILFFLKVILEIITQLLLKSSFTNYFEIVGVVLIAFIISVVEIIMENKERKE